jgi:hypothetical protein
METAINIGYACSLLSDDMQQFTVTAYTPELEELEAEGKVCVCGRVGGCVCMEREGGRESQWTSSCLLSLIRFLLL